MDKKEFIQHAIRHSGTHPSSDKFSSYFLFVDFL